MNCWALLLGIISSCLNFREAQETRKTLILNTEGVISEEEAEQLLIESELPGDVKNIIANFAYQRLKQEAEEFKESNEWLLDRLDRLTIGVDEITYRRRKDNKLLKFSLVEKGTQGIKRSKVNGLGNLIIKIPFQGYNSTFDNYRWEFVGTSPSYSKFFLLQTAIEVDGFPLGKTLWMYDRKKALLKKVIDLDIFPYFQVGIADTTSYGAIVAMNKKLNCFSFNLEDIPLKHLDGFMCDTLNAYAEVRSVSCSPSGSKLGIKIVDKETYAYIYNLHGHRDVYLLVDGKWEKQEEKNNF